MQDCYFSPLLSPINRIVITAIIFTLHVIHFNCSNWPHCNYRCFVRSKSDDYDDGENVDDIVITDNNGDTVHTDYDDTTSNNVSSLLLRSRSRR